MAHDLLNAVGSLLITCRVAQPFQGITNLVITMRILLGLNFNLRCHDARVIGHAQSTLRV